MNETNQLLNELFEEIKELRSELAIVREDIAKFKNDDEQRLLNAIDRVAPAGIENRISVILQNLNIPAHYTGYVYLREAIKQVYLDFKLLKGGVTKALYPMIAKKYETTSARVERAMRHAIETYWYRAGNSDLALKPSNSEFIGSIADTLRLEYEETA